MTTEPQQSHSTFQCGTVRIDDLLARQHIVNDQVDTIFAATIDNAVLPPIVDLPEFTGFHMHLGITHRKQVLFIGNDRQMHAM